MYDPVETVGVIEEPYSDMANPRVYLDLTIGASEPKRVVIELFRHIAPKTAENFRCLCTGEKGTALTYLNSQFHTVVQGLMM
jgi:hypothetical protein